MRLITINNRLLKIKDIGRLAAIESDVITATTYSLSDEPSDNNTEETDSTAVEQSDSND